MLFSDIALMFWIKVYIYGDIFCHFLGLHKFKASTQEVDDIL